MTPRQCGNDPRAQLTPGDQAAVDEFIAFMKEKAEVNPKVVCICGSMRFQDEMAQAAHAESLAGRIVVMPHVNMKAWDTPDADPEQIKADLDQLHRAKIRMAQEVLVVGNYVGESTTAEIAYARYLGMPVRFTHPDVDPGPEATA